MAMTVSTQGLISKIVFVAGTTAISLPLADIAKNYKCLPNKEVEINLMQNDYAKTPNSQLISERYANKQSEPVVPLKSAGRVRVEIGDVKPLEFENVENSEGLIEG